MSEVVVRHLPVQRSARYALAGSHAPLRELWVVLHGYRQLAERFLGRFTRHAEDGRWIVAPEALNRFYLDPGPGRHGPESRVGATWMTREDRDAEIADYVAYLDRLVAHLFDTADGGGQTPVGVLGFSQGGHTAARWAVLGARRPARVVLWGSDLPHDLDPEAARERLREVDLVLVRGAGDEHRDLDLERRHDERLRGWGVVPRYLEHPGGHELDRRVLEVVLDQNSPIRPISGTSS